MSADPFDEHRAAWDAYTSAPWGRVRYAVVAWVLAEALNDLGPGPHRILDVGGGDALDATPLAAAGHDVTLLDPAEGLLGAGRTRLRAAGLRADLRRGGLDDLAADRALADLDGSGGFDAVLCHFVLQYRPAQEPDLARLLSHVRPGGLLSVVAPNPDGLVLARLVRHGPEEALAELDRETARTVTFEETVRKLRSDDVERELVALGAQTVGRFGGRVANDLLTDDEAKDDPAYFDRLLELELALHDREPFRRIGAYWQLLVRRAA